MSGETSAKCLTADISSAISIWIELTTRAILKTVIYIG